MKPDNTFHDSVYEALKYRQVCWTGAKPMNPLSHNSKQILEYGSYSHIGVTFLQKINDFEQTSQMYAKLMFRPFMPDFNSHYRCILVQKFSCLKLLFVKQNLKFTKKNQKVDAEMSCVLCNLPILLALIDRKDKATALET